MPDRGKVYVIDDDEAMRDSLNFLLDSANFNVTLFETALRFLEALPGLEFGCVVSDVRMPGLDGIELLKRMKADHSKFPIVIMTGRPPDRHDRGGDPAGGAGYAERGAHP